MPKSGEVPLRGVSAAYRGISSMAEVHTSPPSVSSAPELIDLKTAARLERSGRGGRPPSISSLCRWIQRGVRLRDGARLYLRAVRVPSGWRTTRKWLNDFHRAL